MDGVTWGAAPVELARPWVRLTMREAVAQHAGEGVDAAQIQEPTRRPIRARGPGGAARHRTRPRARSYGQLLMALFEHLAEPHLHHADVRHRPPGRGLAARQAEAGRPALHRALRALPRRHGDRERLQRAQRPRRPGRALPPAARRPCRRRRGGPPLRSRLRASPGARHAAGGGHRHRHRPPHHADRPTARRSATSSCSRCCDRRRRRGSLIPSIPCGGRGEPRLQRSVSAAFDAAEVELWWSAPGCGRARRRRYTRSRRTDEHTNPE